MARKQVRSNAAHRGVRVFEQRPGATREAGIGCWHDARQRLQCLRHDTPVGIGELGFKTVARARRTERFGGHGAPAPIGVGDDARRRRHAGCGVGLRQRNQGLPPQSEDGALRPCRESRNGAAPAQHAQRGLGLHGDVDVGIGDV